MVTLAQPVSGGGSQRPASHGASQWRMGRAGRLAMAAGASVVLRSAIAHARS